MKKIFLIFGAVFLLSSCSQWAKVASENYDDSYFTPKDALLNPKQEPQVANSNNSNTYSYSSTEAVQGSKTGYDRYNRNPDDYGSYSYATRLSRFGGGYFYPTIIYSTSMNPYYGWRAPINHTGFSFSYGNVWGNCINNSYYYDPYSSVFYTPSYNPWFYYDPWVFSGGTFYRPWNSPYHYNNNWTNNNYTNSSWNSSGSNIMASPGATNQRRTSMSGNTPGNQGRNTYVNAPNAPTTATSPNTNNTNTTRRPQTTTTSGTTSWPSTNSTGTTTRRTGVSGGGTTSGSGTTSGGNTRGGGSTSGTNTRRR